ncbi:hypothetical protein [Bacillus subtilis]|uniref:Uncharacterized protein n=1 Tax=Bacillus subtilis TaxID=1423 RepID=A0AAP1DX92_BACIU|nr:hypothetical protein [Bacillus subtilis]KIN51163.1 hypothetical protein B4146_0623 [Bacillus subtilis]KZD87348.1 hypothetical protein B4122_4572 [Bacillus subtilis]
MKREGSINLAPTISSSKIKEKQFRKQKRIDRLKNKMEAEGATGKEIRKAVYKLKHLEDKKIEEGIQTKYVEPGKKEKVLLREGLLQNSNLEILTTTSSIAEHKITIPEKITKHKEFMEYMQTLNFRFYFNGLQDWNINKTRACIFFEGNKTWIQQDDKGVYRYYSKDEEKHTVQGLNIFDLIEIREGTEIGSIYSMNNARRRLASDLGIVYSERQWEILQEKKYEKNIGIIQRADVEIKGDFPKLFDFIKSYLHLLGHLNDWGVKHILEEEHSFKGESIFFQSTTHMEKIVGKDQTICSRGVNMFAVLGLINKIREEDVPSSLLGVAQAIRGRRNEFRLVNFYTVPALNHQVLSEAEERVERLKRYGITSMTHISKKQVTECFSESFTKKVYVNPTSIREQLLEKSLKDHLYYDIEPAD